jgi:hypothetical protein
VPAASTGATIATRSLAPVRVAVPKGRGAVWFFIFLGGLLLAATAVVGSAKLIHQGSLWAVLTLALALAVVRTTGLEVVGDVLQWGAPSAIEVRDGGVVQVRLWRTWGEMSLRRVRASFAASALNGVEIRPGQGISWWLLVRHVSGLCFYVVGVPGRDEALRVARGVSDALQVPLYEHPAAEQ